MEFGMICPKCKELGLKSTIKGNGYGTSTAMANHPYWDEEGVYHSHSLNISTFEYTCSKGHSLVQSGHNPCPAGDYGGLELEIFGDSSS